MIVETKGKAIEMLNNRLPYPQQMKDIDVDSEKSAISFTWRSSRYRFDLNYCTVDEVDQGCLIGSNTAILMTQCLKQEL